MTSLDASKFAVCTSVAYGRLFGHARVHLSSEAHVNPLLLYKFVMYYRLVLSRFLYHEYGAG